jgi:membrane dipeptidase
MMIPIVDAHLDLAWNALSWNRDLTTSLTEMRQREKAMTDHRGRGKAVITLEEMRRGQVVICLGTLLARAKPAATPPDRRALDFASQEIASAHAFGQLAFYRLLRDRGLITIIDSRTSLDGHWDDPKNLGLIVAMEGADPIVTPSHVEQWFKDGLRVIGLAHYGQSAYAFGTGGDGPLTPAGVKLLKEMHGHHLILDLTHSSDTSFYQALDLFPGPVLASHNNCRAIVPGDRQYSDEQIKLLIQRGAVIGASFDGWMLKPNYRLGQEQREAVTLANVADHIDYICQCAGNTNHVGIGSDLDGGFGYEQTPLEIQSIADVQKLAGVLQARGYASEDVNKIFHGNWLRFFREHLPE